mmetsp:Transcript_4082/g.9505  ORF Transcript_4082/g.9505 Transcript_4082/m.9505 type:complete len:257 (-) Transcript_4082:113-883(-)
MGPEATPNLDGGQRRPRTCFRQSTGRRIHLACLLAIAFTPLEANALSSISLSPALHKCVSSPPTLFQAVMRLRGGKEEGFPEGKWCVRTGKDDDGDSITIFSHSGSGTKVEVDHQYSDGGIVFAASPADPVQCFTAANTLEPADFKLASLVEGHGVGTEDGGQGGGPQQLLSFNPTEADLGDWKCVYLGDCESLKLVNTFFGSTLYILKTGDFVFLSNPLADKSLAGVRGKLIELGRKAGDELVKHLVASLTREAA